jgi:hypothetical protein
MTDSSPPVYTGQARTIKIQCVTDTEHGHGHTIFYAILTSPHLYISLLVNPVRNSSGPLNPALRGGTSYGAEPGIILKHNHFAAAGPEGAEGHYF